MSAPPRRDPLTLSRWSRLKRESRAGAPAGSAASANLLPQTSVPAEASASPAGAAAMRPGPEASAVGMIGPDATPVPADGDGLAAPELPSLDSLTFDADFSAFLQPKVDESLKRAALKKLFADPRFNVMDGLDVYIDDYSKPDPLPPGMLEQLVSARHALGAPQNRVEEERRSDDAPADESPACDRAHAAEPGRAAVDPPPADVADSSRADAADSSRTGVASAPSPGTDPIPDGSALGGTTESGRGAS